MKTGDAVPGDVWLGDQCGQHLELRRAGGDDDVGGAALRRSPARISSAPAAAAAFPICVLSGIILMSIGASHLH